MKYTINLPKEFEVGYVMHCVRDEHFSFRTSAFDEQEAMDTAQRHYDRIGLNVSVISASVIETVCGRTSYSNSND